MKSFKGTAFFFLFVVVMGLYVFWDFTEQKSKEPMAPGEQRLTDFNLSLIQKLKVNQLELSFDKGKCELIQPLKTKCDSTVVAQYVDTLGGLKGKKILEAKDLNEEKKSEFGLGEKALSQISWELNDGSKNSIKIGSENSYDGGFYVEMGDLYLVDRRAGGLTNKSLTEFRNKAPLEGVSEIKELFFKDFREHKDFSIVKEDGVWKWGKEEDFPLSSKAAENWVKALLIMKSTGVVDGQKMGAGDFQMDLKTDVGEIHLSFQGEGEAVRVQRDHGDPIFEFPQVRMDSVLLDQYQLFDRKAPFEFSLEKVVSVKLQRGSEKLEFKKEGTEWTSSQLGEKFKESDLVDLFQKIQSLEVEHYIPRNLKNKIKKNHLEFFDGSGKSIYSIWWDTDQAPYVESQLASARTEKQNWSYGIKKENLIALDQLKFKK
ncbi:MAG TPA: hypothetical protein DCL41_01935 [Bdellovibrionales bacterium]|nr:hypothetical protein [Bdellovibrionales bacterium]